MTYHPITWWQYQATQAFGKTSRPVQWLDKLAAEGDNGDRGVLAKPEDEITAILIMLDRGEIDV